MTPRILIIDDEADMRDVLATLLTEHGFDVSGAKDAAEAQRALSDDGPWDVVVLDEKLEGASGPDTATQLLGEIAARAPEARTIVVTAYATPDLVRTAVAAGAWDYIDKQFQFLKILLPLRVAHAVEAARQRRLRRMQPADVERALRETWSEALSAKDRHRKGQLLEETLSLLLGTMHGFHEIQTRRLGRAEEIDIIVTNASTDPILAREGSYLLVECKNWSGPIGPGELAIFRDKLRRRYGRVRLGVLVSVGGFTEGVRDHVALAADGDCTIVLVDGGDLTRWIDATDRVAWLRERVATTVMRG